MAEWIVPKGKTQKGIDAQFTVDQKEQEKVEALQFLAVTDHEVLKAVELYLEAQGAIDSALLVERREARNIIKGRH